MLMTLTPGFSSEFDLFTTAKTEKNWFHICYFLLYFVKAGEYCKKALLNIMIFIKSNNFVTFNVLFGVYFDYSRI